MKKYFLSSMLVMGLMVPAFGADGIITGGAGTCTVDVLGVYDNNATANTIATWALNDYKCGAGQYLDEDTLACITCPTGSYCPGGTYTVENADEGTNACPTGYKNSDAGASADTQCYTNCKVSDIAHATAVTGNDYYGSGTDTCTATDCELGYHVDGDLELFEKPPVIPVNYEISGRSNYAYINPDGSSNFVGMSEDTLTMNGTWVAEFDYGRVYGKASCQPSADPTYIWLMNNLENEMASGKTLEEIKLKLATIGGPAKAEVMIRYLEFSLAMQNGTVDIEEIFENFAEFFVVYSEPSDKNYLTDSTGQYCYCQVDGFSPMTDGVLAEKTNVTSAPWVFNFSQGSAESCAYDCAHECWISMFLPEEDCKAFRAALFDAMDYRMTGGMCKITENNCPAGQYLAIVGDAMMCVPCKSGSYCPGGVYTIESEYKGTNVCPSGFPNSDAGAGADTQCYTACTLETANIAHATAVSGNDYYGAGTDTCSATACATGYHVNNDIKIIEKTAVINVDFNSINGVAAKNGNGEEMNNNLPNAGLTENNTIAVSFSNGIMYGRASCQPSADPVSLYVMENLGVVMNGDKTIDAFRAEFEPIAGVNKTDFAIDLFNRLQLGSISMDEAQIELIAVFMTDKNANYTTSSAGQYCYFQVNGFAPSGGTKSDIVGLPWMLYPEPFESDEECASNCIMSGAESVLQLAPVALGALDYAEISTCAANTINIDWNPDNGGAHTQNMCTYDGAITLPDDPVKPGFTFAGWKLVE